MRRRLLCSLMLVAACGDNRRLDTDAATPAGEPDGRLDARLAPQPFDAAPAAPDAATSDASPDAATPAPDAGTSDASPDAATPAPDAATTPLQTRLSITCTGGGQVSGPMSAACGTTTTLALPTTTSLFETPAHGDRFDGWAGACATTARRCDLVLDVATPPAITAEARFVRQYAWSAPIATSDYDEVFDVAAAPGGDTLVVAGHGVTAELVRRDGAGAVRWSRPLSAAPSVVIAHAVTVTVDGTVVVAGRFAGTLDAGSGPMVSAGDYDAFVAAYHADGTPAWSLRWGDAGRDAALGVAPLDDGGAVVTGSFSDTIEIGAAALTSAGGSDGFAVRLDAAHAVVAAARFGGAGDDRLHGVAVHGGTIAAIAWAPTPAVIGIDATMNGTWSHPLLADTSSEFDATQRAAVAVAPDGTIVTAATADWTAVVTRRTSDGATLSERTFPEVRLYDLAVAPDGDLLLGGEAWIGADLGGGGLPVDGTTDLLIARLGPAFEHRWSSVFGASFGSFQQVDAIAAAADGSVRFGGINGHVLDLGGGPFGNDDGDLDAFVASFH